MEAITDADGLAEPLGTPLQSGLVKDSSLVSLAALEVRVLAGTTVFVPTRRPAVPVANEHRASKIQFIEVRHEKPVMVHVRPMANGHGALRVEPFLIARSDVPIGALLQDQVDAL